MYRGMVPPLLGVTPIFAVSFWVSSDSINPCASLKSNMRRTFGMGRATTLVRKLSDLSHRIAPPRISARQNTLLLALSLLSPRLLSRPPSNARRSFSKSKGKAARSRNTRVFSTSLRFCIKRGASAVSSEAPVLP